MSAPAFVFTSNPTFKAEVEVQWPDGESFRTFVFTGHFVMADGIDLAAPIEAANSIDRMAQEIDRLKQVFTGWDGIETETGEPLPVTDDAMANLLRQVPIRRAITTTYIAQVYGGGLRLGNFAPSPASSGAKAPKKKKAPARR